MHYVYLLENSSIADRRYIGVTSDLSQRLREHNQGKYFTYR
jgi:predicted GIY-YIG superfamily endonuclease